MKRLSFIFNFKKALPRVLIFVAMTVACLFILDRLTFETFFPLYDQWLRVGSSLKASDVLVVGSSHIEADVDIKELEVKGKKTVGLFSVPGAGVLARYYAIKERFDEKNVPKPQVIILEVSKMVFNPIRYQDNIASYLLPYRNKGYYQDYFKEMKPPEYFWPRTLQSYSLNGSLGKFSEPGNVARFFLEHFLPTERYLKVREHFNGPYTSCLTQPHLVDPRISEWELIRKKNSFNNTIDLNRIKVLDKIIYLARENNVSVVLLMPPFFRFADEFPSDGYEHIIEILKSRQGPGVTYLAPTVPNDSCLFVDDGHLTREGRDLYTSLILKSGVL